MPSNCESSALRKTELSCHFLKLIRKIVAKYVPHIILTNLSVLSLPSWTVCFAAWWFKYDVVWCHKSGGSYAIPEDGWSLPCKHSLTYHHESEDTFLSAESLLVPCLESNYWLWMFSRALFSDATCMIQDAGKWRLMRPNSWDSGITQQKNLAHSHPSWTTLALENRVTKKHGFPW